MDAQKLASILIRHELASHNLDVVEADKLVRMLNQAIEYQREKLQGRYVTAQAKGIDRGPATTKFIEESIAALEAVNREVYAKIGERIEGQLIARAKHEFGFARDAVKSAGGKIDFGTTIPDTNFLRTLVRNAPLPLDEHTTTLLQPWLRDAEKNHLDRLGRILRNSMIAGDTPAVLAKQLEEQGFAKSRRSAQSLALTANASVANQSRLETYRKMRGITHVEWSSVLDTRTSEGCRDLSGQIFPLDAPHPAPPRHIRCRSMLLPRKNATDVPLHKPYAEWAAEQDAGTVEAAGTVRTLDDLKAADAKLTGTIAARPFSPINPAITSASIAVRPRKAVIQDLSRRFAQNAADPRYDPKPEFRASKATDFGKAALSANITDETASMMAALMTEADAIADAFAVPRLRAIKTGEGAWAARMGDGNLSINHVHFNGYAGEIGGNAGISKADAVRVEYEKVRAELTKMREAIEAQKLLMKELTGAERDAATMKYLDLADEFNARRKVFLKLDKQLLKARTTDRAAEIKEASTWMPGDDVTKRPYTSAGYFASPLDRARSTVYHEIAHHVHQMTRKTDRRAKATPPVERELKSIFFNKFHGRGPNGQAGYELKKLVASTYATTDPHEWFAENFAFYMMGRFDLVEDEAKELIERLLKEAIK